MREAFLKRLFSMIKCDSCGQNYEIADIDTLGHEGDIWLFSVLCGFCQTKGLIAILAGEGDAVEAATDLTEAEHEKFTQGVSVKVDDVLDMHNFLKGYYGDFAGILSER